MTVPFHPNDETGLHCFQATFHMMLDAILPERAFTMKEIIVLSGVQDSMSTWPSRMLLELDKMGLEVVMIEGFDGKDFIKRGAQYLKDTFGEEAAAWQIAHSDIEKEQRDYQELYDRNINIIKQIPTLEDIGHYIDTGYLVSCVVNSKRLRDESGYVGHSVVVLSIDDHTVTLHNPGPPPFPNQRVDTSTFLAAWAYPDENAQNFIAIRKK